MTQKIFIDTDLLSSFLWVNKINYLVKALPGFKIQIPIQVANEIHRPLPGLKTIQNRFAIAKANGDLSILQDFDADTPEHREYLRLTQGINYPLAIGRGEAACIVWAKTQNAWMGSNNLKDISYFVSTFGLQCITTCDILLALFDQLILNEEELSKIYRDMVKEHRFLPYATFSLLLEARESGQYHQKKLP